VGTLLGDNKINIAAMHVGRAKPGDFAVMILALDGPIPAPVLRKIDQLPNIVRSRLVEL
jgi:D-3-phosphoglycerate dehydrogenase